MQGIVYILTNESMPGLVKLGQTAGALTVRIRQLFTTGVPLPFELYYACEVADEIFVESQLHDAFGDHRVSRNREFFRIAPERIKAALKLASIKEIKLGDEIFENLEDKADVVAAKRRTIFQFSMIGLQPGAELSLARNPDITCTTLDDKNRVMFDGEETSLSDAALSACKSLGYDWLAVSGPWEWTYNGKRLDDLRREIDEKID